MGDINWIGLLTALGGLGAITLFVREIFSILTLLRKGVAAKETKRRNDIIGQRDAALRRAEHAEARVDQERANRRLVEAFAAVLMRDLILAGGTPAAWPDIDETTDNPSTN